MQSVPPPYVAVPMAILEMDRLRPSSKLAWAFLRNREQAGWTRLPQIQLIAAYVGLTRQAVARSLRQLAESSPVLLLLETRQTPAGPRTYYRTGAVPVGPALRRATGPRSDKQPAALREVTDPRSAALRHTYKEEVTLTEKEERKVTADGLPPPGSTNDSETATAKTATATTATAAADLPSPLAGEGGRRPGEGAFSAYPTGGDSDAAAPSHPSPAAARHPLPQGERETAADTLNPDEARLLRHIFPHGCTRNQRVCLMQAVVSGLRAGATCAYLANAAAAPSEKTAPWRVMEDEVAKLRRDAALASKCFESPGLARLSAYVAALHKNGAGTNINAWVHKYPDILARARWLFEWPK
jgi:hypothetical protein